MNEEICIVVDKDDNVLDYLPRSVCHSDPEIIERTVAVIVLNDKNELLLQKRSMRKDSYPGFYTLGATGHVSKGESYEEAAKKELMEELGIEGRLTFLGKRYKDDPQHKEMQGFFVTVSSGPFRVEHKEIEEVRFFRKEAIGQMLTKCTPTVRIALELLAQKESDGKKA